MAAAAALDRAAATAAATAATAAAPAAAPAAPAAARAAAAAGGCRGALALQPRVVARGDQGGAEAARAEESSDAWASCAVGFCETLALPANRPAFRAASGPGRQKPMRPGGGRWCWRRCRPEDRTSWSFGRPTH